MQAPYLTYDFTIDGNKYHVELEVVDYGDCNKCFWEVYRMKDGTMQEVPALSRYMPVYPYNYGNDVVKSALIELLKKEDSLSDHLEL